MKQLLSDSAVREFKRVLLSCMELNNSTKGLLYLLDMESGDFRLAAYYGYLKRSAQIENYEYNHPLISIIFRKRSAFQVNDPIAYPDLNDYLSQQDIQSAQITPIYYDDRIAGFIEERNRAGNQYYTDETAVNSKRIADEVKSIMEKKDGRQSEDSGDSLQEELGRSVQYFLIRFASFRRYLPGIVSFFQDAVQTLKPAVSFDSIILNLTMGEKSLHFVYSVQPLSQESRQLMEDSLAEFFPFLGSGDNVTSHFIVERMGDEPFNGRPETHSTMNVLEKNGFSAYLAAVRCTPNYFEGEEVAALSRFSRMLGGYLNQVIREYRCVDTYIGLILNLLELSKSSGYNFRIHALNTAKFARSISEKMSEDVDFVDAVTIAALLHDIGILLIDPDLFEKDSVLSITDFEKIKAHTKVCLKFLEKIRLPQDIRKMIQSHHERIDGTGYPDGLEGDEIPLGARIISVAEAFEVMTGKSGYRKSMTAAEAMQEIKDQQGKQFDRKVVTVLSEILKRKK